MSIKLASQNAKGLRNRSKAPRLLCELLPFGVDVVAIEQIRFVCSVDACVLSNNFVAYSAYGD